MKDRKEDALKLVYYEDLLNTGETGILSVAKSRKLERRDCGGFWLHKDQPSVTSDTKPELRAHNSHVSIKAK